MGFESVGPKKNPAAPLARQCAAVLASREAQTELVKKMESKRCIHSGVQDLSDPISFPKAVSSLGGPWSEHSPFAWPPRSQLRSTKAKRPLRGSGSWNRRIDRSKLRGMDPPAIQNVHGLGNPGRGNPWAAWNLWVRRVRHVPAPSRQGRMMGGGKTMKPNGPFARRSGWLP
jgi:hypothetical protein